MRSCLKPQKSMFKSWDSGAIWTRLLKVLDKVYLGPDLFAWHNTESVWPWLISSPMLLFAKTLTASMTLWRRYDVLMFDADAILFRKILCKKMDILMFKGRFQCSLGWNQDKDARITITHLCFTALALAGSLRRSGTLDLHLTRHWLCQYIT